MATRYLTEVIGPEALAAQARAYGRSYRLPPAAAADALGEDEASFISERDSFYLATVTSNGWPYVQHRGGPKGFLRVLDPHTLGYADLRGNRQLVTTGNIAASDRVALLLMDYPRRERLKLLGHARILAPADDPALADALSPAPELRTRVERLVLVSVIGFDWNCPAYITPRYTEAEIERATAPLRARIAQLEAERARSWLAK
jgi:uncharacterized protein